MQKHEQASIKQKKQEAISLPGIIYSADSNARVDVETTKNKQSQGQARFNSLGGRRINSEKTEGREEDYSGQILKFDEDDMAGDQTYQHRKRKFKSGDVQQDKSLDTRPISLHSYYESVNDKSPRKEDNLSLSMSKSFFIRQQIRRREIKGNSSIHSHNNSGTAIGSKSPLKVRFNEKQRDQNESLPSPLDYKEGKSANESNFLRQNGVTPDKFLTSKIKKKFGGSSGLNAQVIEMWINDTLAEAQSDKIQTNLSGELNIKPKVSLADFGLDRKALKNKGVTNDGVDRVYRSLFVYSFGLYEMLQEQLDHLDEKDIIMAQVWQTYGILLEYCARGEFTATVNVLEKKRMEMEGELKKLIAEQSSHLQEIEGNEHQIREKFEETIRQLTQENENLLEEKNRLIENNKILDKQFNDEARMRLQFEHKINELYSVYREQCTKQRRLLSDKLQIEKQVESLKIQIQGEVELKMEELKKQAVSQEEVKVLQGQITKLKNDCDRFEQMGRDVRSKMDALLKQKQEGSEELILKNTIINSLTFDCNNLRNEFRQKEEIQKRLEEEKGFHILQISKHETKEVELLNELESTRKKLNEKENELFAFKPIIDFGELKIKEGQEIITKKNNEIERLDDLQKNFKTELQFLRVRVTDLENERENVEVVLQKLKSGQGQAEAEYLKAIQKISQLSYELEEAKLEIKDKILLQEEVASKFIGLNNECKLTQEINENEINSWKAKCFKAEKEFKRALEEWSSETSRLNETIKEKEVLVEQVFEQQKTIIVLKELSQRNTFEREDIGTLLKQKDIMIETLQEQTQSLSLQLSEWKIKNEKSERALISATTQLIESQKGSKEEIASIIDRYEKEISHLRRNDTKVPGMIFEDLLGQAIKLSELSEQKQKIIEKLEKELKQTQNAKAKLEEEHTDLKQKMHEQQVSTDNTISQQKQKIKSLSDQVDNRMKDIDDLNSRLKSMRILSLSEIDSIKESHQYEISRLVLQKEKDFQMAVQQYEERIKELEEFFILKNPSKQQAQNLGNSKTKYSRKDSKYTRQESQYSRQESQYSRKESKYQKQESKIINNNDSQIDDVESQESRSNAFQSNQITPKNITSLNSQNGSFNEIANIQIQQISSFQNETKKDDSKEDSKSSEVFNITNNKSNNINNNNDDDDNNNKNNFKNNNQNNTNNNSNSNNNNSSNNNITNNNNNNSNRNNNISNNNNSSNGNNNRNNSNNSNNNSNNINNNNKLEPTLEFQSSNKFAVAHEAALIPNISQKNINILDSIQEGDCQEQIEEQQLFNYQSLQKIQLKEEQQGKNSNLQTFSQKSIKDSTPKINPLSQRSQDFQQIEISPKDSAIIDQLTHLSQQKQSLNISLSQQSQQLAAKNNQNEKIQPHLELVQKKQKQKQQGQFVNVYGKQQNQEQHPPASRISVRSSSHSNSRQSHSKEIPNQGEMQQSQESIEKHSSKENYLPMKSLSLFLDPQYQKQQSWPMKYPQSSASQGKQLAQQIGNSKSPTNNKKELVDKGQQTDISLLVKAIEIYQQKIQQQQSQQQPLQPSSIKPQKTINDQQQNIPVSFQYVPKKGGTNQILKQSEKYPTDKHHPNVKLNNSELAKIFQDKGKK